MIGIAGALLAATLQSVSPERLHELGQLERSEEVRSIEFAPDGSVWFAAGENGLARVLGDQVSFADEADGLMSKGIADLLLDSSGRLWAAGLNGFALFQDEQWEPESTLGELVPRVIFGLHEDSATGAMWFATSSGAARLEEGQWDVVRLSDGLPHSVVHAVLVDPRGTVWFACRRGLARQTDGVLETFFEELNFRSAVLGPDGVAWFGSSDGVFGWDGERWERHLRGIGVFPRLVDSGGTVWAVSDGEGMYRYDGVAWQAHVVPAEVGESDIHDVVQDAEGRLWLATSKGLAWLED